MTLLDNDMEPGAIARAINGLLTHYGYPPEKVDSWWNDWAYEALGGLTPTQAWLNHEYRRVWEMIKAAYASSEDAGKRLAKDSAHVQLIEARLAELERRYGL